MIERMERSYVDTSYINEESVEKLEGKLIAKIVEERVIRKRRPTQKANQHASTLVVKCMNKLY